LPAIAGGGDRFWGKDLLVPLGYRTYPDLPERDLCESIGVGDDEIGLLRLAGGAADDGGPAVLAVIPAEAFEPLSRAAVRLALREGSLP
jgi:hypothetical protein